MIGTGSYIKEAWVVLPVVILLLAGGAIALQSGVQRTGAGRDTRQLAGNFGRMLLRVMGYVAVLFALQNWVGLGPTMGW
jgi:hypothetical protein